MLPKDFKSGMMYTRVIQSEIYSLEPSDGDYRVEVSMHTQGSGNFNYFIKIFSSDYPLHFNGWTLHLMTFHKAWSVNHSPSVDITDPNGIKITSLKIPDVFAKSEANYDGFLEERITETYDFLRYISQYRSIEDFNFVHTTTLSSVKDVMKYYLDFLKIKYRLPLKIQIQVENRIRNYFEKYLQDNL